MSGWKEVLLTNYYNISSGLSKPASEFGRGFPFLSFKDVFWNYFVPNELTSLVNSNKKEQQSCSIKYGDIFLTRTSEKAEELGLSSVALKDYPNATFNGFTKRLRPKSKNEIDPVFIGFYLRSPKFRNEIGAYSSLITRASLNNGAINRLKIYIPEYRTQQRIGSILLRYNNLIENNLKRIKLLEELAQCTYEEWFIKYRVNGEALVIDEDTGLPVGWTEMEFRYFGEVITGKTPSTSNQAFFNGPVPFVKTPDMSGFPYVISTTQTLSSVGADSQKKKFIPKNSLMISCIGSAGVYALASEDCQTNQQINSIVFYKEYYVFYFYCLAKKLKPILEGLGSNGATMTNVNKGKFELMKAICPDVATLREFHKQSVNNFNLILNLQKQNRILKQSRDILLPRLMNGIINVEEAEENFAMAAEQEITYKTENTVQ